MASRLKQTLTPCQEKELFALELSQESKKQLEDLLRLRPKNWLTFFPKGVDTLFKEIMRSVKIKPELARQGLHCYLGFDPTRECPDNEYF